MRLSTTKAHALWALAAFGAAVTYPGAAALAGGPVQGNISAKNASVKLSSASCGHSVLLISYSAVVRFEFWVKPTRGPAGAVNSNLWTGTGEKALYVSGGCMTGETGWIQAVGVSGKFPAAASSQEQGGGTSPNSAPVKVVTPP
jgi:hypothetical protein